MSFISVIASNPPPIGVDLRQITHTPSSRAEGVAIHDAFKELRVPKDGLPRFARNDAAFVIRRRQGNLKVDEKLLLPLGEGFSTFKCPCARDDGSR